MTLVIKCKDTDNIIGLKEEIAMRLEGVAGIERIDLTWPDEFSPVKIIVKEHVKRDPFCEGEAATVGIKYYYNGETHGNYEQYNKPELTALEVENSVNTLLEAMFQDIAKMKGESVPPVIFQRITNIPKILPFSEEDLPPLRQIKKGIIE